MRLFSGDRDSVKSTELAMRSGGSQKIEGEPKIPLSGLKMNGFSV
jgi:hypothetical protein